MPIDHRRWTLRLDAIFLACAGGAAMILETVGHFTGNRVPLARRADQPA
jgi:hypothetical protein